MSEIRVDTISEKTSANGVAIDGVVIKDNTIDVNGTAGALILDADADTKIQASTDDNIEFLTGGAKQFNITNSGSIQAFRDSATSFGPSYLGQHQRGTIASPSIVSSGDRLVEFKSTAYDGTAYIDGPRISFRVDGTPGDDDMPSRIEFQTVADGANSLTERMRIHSSGVVSIPGGVELGSALDATAANTLDDYEEGTWTSTMTTTGTAFTTSSNTQTQFYTKVGRLVTLSVSASVASPTSGSGNLKITGLPFTSGSHDTVYSNIIRPGRIDMTEGDGIFATMFSSSSTITFEKATNNGNPTDITATDLNGNTTPFVGFSFSYYV